MGKTSSASKRKYNKASYRRYEISLPLDSILTYKLDEHKNNGGNITEVIKYALMKYYDLTPNDLIFPYVPDELKLK